GFFLKGLTMDWQSDKRDPATLWFSLSSRAAEHEQGKEWHIAALLWKEAAQYAKAHLNIEWANLRGDFCTLRANRLPKYNE
ncbi:ANR family transcriptional regulator, partial [Enterobacter hormaechei]